MDMRLDNAVLHEHEIEAIKINQEIIKRMADNSQRLKNYFLIFCGILTGLLGSNVINNQNSIYVALGFIIIGIIFWFMDACYLKLERQFREHHKAIINGTIGYKKQFDFNPLRYPSKPVYKIMFDNFSILIYPIMIIIFSIAIIYLPAL